MHIHKIFSLAVLLIVLGTACEEDIDKEKPSIDLSIPDAFPVNCDTLYFRFDHDRLLFLLVCPHHIRGV